MNDQSNKPQGRFALRLGNRMSEEAYGHYSAMSIAAGGLDTICNPDSLSRNELITAGNAGVYSKRRIASTRAWV